MPHKDPEARKAYIRAYNNRPYVKARSRELQRKYYHENPKVRDGQLLRTKKRLRLKKEIISGRPCPDVCDICGKSDSWPWPRLHFDHCHKHGHFRGWLCARCNVILGHVEDDPDLLLKMVAYLKRAPTATSAQFTLPGI